MMQRYNHPTNSTRYRKALWVFLLAFVVLRIVLGFFYTHAQNASSEVSPKLVGGVINAQAWDFSVATLPLLGDVQAAPFQLCTPQTAATCLWTVQPPPWQRGFPDATSAVGAIVPKGYQPYGYGSYRLRIQLPKPVTLVGDSGSDSLPQTYALILKHIDTAFILWVDGVRRLDVGTVGTTDATTQPQVQPHTLLVQPQPGQSTLELFFQVSNFRYPTAALRASEDENTAKLSLGDFANVTQAQKRDATFALLWMGILIALGVYHLAIFVQRPVLKTFFHFGLTCLLLALQSEVYNQPLAYWLLPGASFKWKVTFDYVAIYALSLAFLYYCSNLFPDDLKGLGLRALQWFFWLLIVSAVLFPVSVFVMSVPLYLNGALATLLYVLYGLIRAYTKKRPNIGYMMISVLLCLPFVILEALFIAGNINIEGLGTLGTALFIFLQALLLSRQSGQAYNRLAALSEALEHTNQQLETRVTERTHQLEQANQQIHSLNESLAQENQRMSSELQVTQRLQSLLLPTTNELQQVLPLDVAAFNLAATEVGGDYYDVLKIDEDIYIGIGDVTGHGLESGMLMLMTQMGIRSLLEGAHQQPAALLTILNRSLYQNIVRMEANKSMTLMLLQYRFNQQTGLGTVCMSGQHEDVLLVRQTTKDPDTAVDVQKLDTLELGFPLGLEPHLPNMFQQKEITFAASEGLVLYTDGITEASNPEGMLYGLERLTALVAATWSHHSPSAIVQLIINDVAQHRLGRTVSVAEAATPKAKTKIATHTIESKSKAKDTMTHRDTVTYVVDAVGAANVEATTIHHALEDLEDDITLLILKQKAMPFEGHALL